MKSPMVTNLDCVPDKDSYTELRVLRSAAGYYVGTLHTDEDGFTGPGSRDSDYFRTSQEAERFLRMVSEVPNPNEYLRMEP
ncbi:hypothetical protein SAMN05443245_5191 [Paraburkholderia fungorum]|uniref:Uncharacterized protein n=1 Tax=Paraburkholderia fungorum TaxID=134537 RepID=A0A1H1IHJ4_9BURK|nr:hypothetical protein SAMN05443245_5191 [Paraburkholderia fungorum]